MNTHFAFAVLSILFISTLMGGAIGLVLSLFFNYMPLLVVCAVLGFASGLGYMSFYRGGILPAMLTETIFWAMFLALWFLTKRMLKKPNKGVA